MSHGDVRPPSERSSDNKRDRFEVACVATMWIVVTLGAAAIATGATWIFTTPLKIACLLTVVYALVSMTKGALHRG